MNRKLIIPIKKTAFSIDRFFLYLYLVMCFIPWLSRIIPGEIQILFFLPWAIFAFFRFNKMPWNRYVLQVLLMVAMLLYVAIRHVLTPVDVRSAFGNAFVYILFSATIYFTMVCDHSMPHSEILSAFKLIYFCVILTAITSFITLCINIDASKIVTGMGSGTKIYKWANIADYLYSFVFGIVAVMSVYIGRMKRFVKKKGYIQYYIVAVFLLIVTVMCSSMIAIFSSVGMLMLYWLVTMRKGTARTLTYLTLGVLMLLFIILYITSRGILYDIGMAIAKVIDIGNIQARLIQIVESLFGDADLTLSGRTDLWQISIDTIKQFPIFGSGFTVGRTYLSAHSQILDDIAKLGIVGYTLEALIFLSVFSVAFKYRKTIAFRMYVSIMLGVIFFAVMNLCMSITLNIVLMIVLPMMCKIEAIYIPNYTKIRPARRYKTKGGSCEKEKIDDIHAQL